MISKYGYIYNKQLSENYEDVAKQIFSCLIKREEDDEQLPYFITCLNQRVYGLSLILHSPPELITVMSLLEAARTEEDFGIYRKFILDACSIMYKLRDQLAESDE